MKKLLLRGWGAWKQIAHAIGRFQTRVLLTVFYFLILGGAWILMRLFGRDPLNRRSKNISSYWGDAQLPDGKIESARHQF